MRKLKTMLAICAIHIVSGFVVYKFLLQTSLLYDKLVWYVIWVPIPLAAFAVSDTLMEKRHPKLCEDVRVAVCGFFTACLVLFCMLSLIFIAKGMT